MEMIDHKFLMNLRALFDIATKKTKGDYRTCGPILYTSYEQHLMNNEMKKNGVKRVPWGKGKDYCEYLDKQGCCVVYNERPILCRAAGVVKDMKGYEEISCTDNPIESPEEMGMYIPLCNKSNLLYQRYMKKFSQLLKPEEK